MPLTLVHVLLYTLAVGLAIPVGASLASIEKLPRGEPRTALLHMITAFGGGVLLAAVALVLVPKGVEELAIGWVIVSFIGGALAVYALDKLIEERGSKLAQVFAMLLDFVPEAVALGALFTVDPQTGPLLSLLIGMQNLPEGFNAYSDLRKSKMKRAKALWLLAAMALLGPIAGAAGYGLLRELPGVVGGIMLGASAGILYLTFQDIAPQAVYRRHWSPPLGAVLGFLVGLIGRITLGGH